jgi:hypothetical protein
LAFRRELGAIVLVLLAAGACAQRGSTPADSSIYVILATYGYNCGATPGNVLDDVKRRCQGNLNCEYTVDASLVGDPAPGCPKDFIVNYRCFDGARERRILVEAESSGNVASLTCE